VASVRIRRIGRRVQFRKVAGHRALPTLAAALRKRDAAIDHARGVDNRKQAA